MKSLTEHLWFETPHRRDYLNITGAIEQLVRKRGVQEGLCLVNAMHTSLPAQFQLRTAFFKPCSQPLEEGRVGFRGRQAQ
jgi:hypothetical protein